MKKVVAKTTKKSDSEIEMLARLVRDGFKELQGRFDKNVKDTQKRFDKIEHEIEALARFTRDGLTRVDKQFDFVNKQFGDVDERFNGMDKRFRNIDARFELVNTQLSAINHEQDDHTKRLERIEKKQAGTLANLDESVHRSEFHGLLVRVDKLEKNTAKK